MQIDSTNLKSPRKDLIMTLGQNKIFYRTLYAISSTTGYGNDQKYRMGIHRKYPSGKTRRKLGKEKEGFFCDQSPGI